MTNEPSNKLLVRIESLIIDGQKELKEQLREVDNRLSGQITDLRGEVIHIDQKIDKFKIDVAKQFKQTDENIKMAFKMLSHDIE